MFGQNVMDALASPDTFFAERADEVPFWQPAVVVLIVALLSVVPSMLVLERVAGSAGGFGETALGVVQLVSAVVSVVVVFVVWLVVAGLIHGLSALAGAEQGSFTATARDVGWGYLPSIVGTAVGAYATWAGLQQLPSSVSAQALSGQLQSLTVVQISTGVSVLVILWQGVIWTYATRDGRGLDLRRAAAVVAVPVALNLALTLWGAV